MRPVRPVVLSLLVGLLVLSWGSMAWSEPVLNDVSDGQTVPPQPRESYVLALSGDTLIHPAVAASAGCHALEGLYDFRPMFSQLSLVIESADLALCHLEVPLDPASQNISGFPLFSAPAEIAEGLADAGYDGCSTASNHSLDREIAGALETLDVLDDAGLGHAGTARNPEDAAGTLYDLGTLTIGHTAYAYGFQNGGVPAERPWLVNRIDAERIVSDAADLRGRGAGFVVVSLHWGVEFSASPTAGQKALAAELLASPSVDLIVGHHSHVLQPIGEASGKTVIYGLGNFLSNQTAPCCPPQSEEGALVLVRIDRADSMWQVGEIVHVPTWVDRRSGHIVTPALGEQAEASHRCSTRGGHPRRLVNRPVAQRRHSVDPRGRPEPLAAVPDTTEHGLGCPGGGVCASLPRRIQREHPGMGAMNIVRLAAAAGGLSMSMSSLDAAAEFGGRATGWEGESI